MAVAFAFVVAFLLGAQTASAQEQYRSAITDLPPAVVHGQEDVELLVDQAPFGEVILRVCSAFEADCAVAGAPGLLIGYTCSGTAESCWRQFISAVALGGVDVRITPKIGGASYFFLSGTSGAGSIRRAQVPVQRPGISDRSPPPAAPPPPDDSGTGGQ